MLLYSKDLDNRNFDFCVVGSGPAGIITVLELERLTEKRSILFLEYGVAGDGTHNALDDYIHLSNPEHHYAPAECTNKGLGGTSETWGGRCVMYDKVDFLPRAPFAEHCTWPANILSDLQPYLAKADSYFECAPGGFTLREQPGIDYQPIAEGFREGPVTDSVIEKWSRPTRFAAQYGDAVKKSKNIWLCEGIELRQLGVPNPSGQVEEATVRDRAGVQRKVKASCFILAMGGQETTRVLMKSPTVFEKRGGMPPALGRYYQGHLSGKIASVQFAGDPEKTDFGFKRLAKGEYIRRRLQFTSQALQDHGILNTALWLDNPHYFDLKHRSGAMSFMYLAMLTPRLGRRLAPPTIAHSITKGKVNKVGAHVANILRDLPGSLLVPASIFVRRYCMRRKLPGVFLHSRANLYALHFHAEQIPTTENRMELDQGGESLDIHYGYTDKDVESVIKAHELLDDWLKQCGCGHLVYWYPQHELGKRIRDGSKDGVHQVGTTRMSAQMEEGVVDKNLMLWGTTNVFVCSSSVFPTSGQANPTFLLGIFAARLGHFLSARCATRN